MAPMDLENPCPGCDDHMTEKQQKFCLFGFAGACVISLIIFIVAMTAYHHLGPDDQILVKSAVGNTVINGPGAVQTNPFKGKEWRKAILLNPLQYAIVQDMLTAQVRHEEGDMLLFLGAYDELKSVEDKIVLEKDSYIRLVDKQNGQERVVQGPSTTVPSPTEYAPDGIKKAVFLDMDSAAVVLNKQTGLRRLETYCTHSGGVLYPAPQEEVVEVRSLIHVLPHQAMIVRDVEGTTTVYSGADPSSGQGCHQSTNPAEQGTSFFLKPYSKIVRMYWSDYSDPNKAKAAGSGNYDPAPAPAPSPSNASTASSEPKSGLSEAGDLPSSMFTTPTQSVATSGPKVPVVAIDLRSRKSFYSYEVRTSDNVKLLLEGTIFWQISDVHKMINMTSDPEGDVWSRSRSTLISAVSNVTLGTFMNGFNDIVTHAFNYQSHDSFYMSRGITLSSMELTSYESVDAHTKRVLQEIIRETTKRINRLQKQRSDNEVRQEKLVAEISLERNRTQLIETQALNEKLLAETRGATEGGSVAMGIASFVDGLNSSLPNLTGRVELYRLHESLTAAKTDTEQLSSGKASLYIAPKEMDLRLDMPHNTAEL